MGQREVDVDWLVKEASVNARRLNREEPNIQNIPIRTPEGTAIRGAFTAAPGNLAVSLDYSQIELRILAHIADTGPMKGE